MATGLAVLMFATLPKQGKGSVVVDGRSYRLVLERVRRSTVVFDYYVTVSIAGIDLVTFRSKCENIASAYAVGYVMRSHQAPEGKVQLAKERILSGDAAVKVQWFRALAVGKTALRPAAPRGDVYLEVYPTKFTIAVDGEPHVYEVTDYGNEYTTGSQSALTLYNLVRFTLEERDIIIDSCLPDEQMFNMAMQIDGRYSCKFGVSGTHYSEITVTRASAPGDKDTRDIVTHKINDCAHGFAKIVSVVRASDSYNFTCHYECKKYAFGGLKFDKFSDLIKHVNQLV